MTDRSWRIDAHQSTDSMASIGRHQPAGERIIRAFLLLGFGAVLLIEIWLLIRAFPLG